MLHGLSFPVIPMISIFKLATLRPAPRVRHVRTRASTALAALASVTSLTLLASLASAPALAAGATMPLADPALGLVEGQLPILPGWTGTATIDRVSDPVGGGSAQWAVDLQSPDRSRGIRILPVSFHTFAPALQQSGPPAPPQSNAYLVFHSTAELLTQHILPRLGLGGEPSAPFAIDREKIAAAMAKLPANGAPNPFHDSAAVVVRNAVPGQEILVEAVTVGFARGLPNEMSTTQVHCTTRSRACRTWFPTRTGCGPIRPSPTANSQRSRSRASARERRWTNGRPARTPPSRPIRTRSSRPASSGRPRSARSSTSRTRRGAAASRPRPTAARCFAAISATTA